MAIKKENTCICRIFLVDLPAIIKEFELNKFQVQKNVKRLDKYEKFMLVKDVYLVKYYIRASTKRKCNIHNYYLHGDEQKIKDILSRTCGLRSRGCFIPLITV